VMIPASPVQGGGGGIPKNLGILPLLDRALPTFEKTLLALEADQLDCAHDDDQDNSQHHGILRDVLTCFIGPKLA